MKANMMIIRGCDAEFVGESWALLQFRAYVGLSAKKQDSNGTSHFDLVLLVAGHEPIKREVTFYPGCNVLAIPNDVVDLIPAEFADPIEAMRYAMDNKLEYPPQFPSGMAARALGLKPYKRGRR